MKKSHFSVLRVIALVVIVLLLAQIAVLADSTTPADVDLTSSAAGGNNAPGGNANIIRTTSTQGVSGGCVPVIAGVFSFDVSTLSSDVPSDSVTLEVTVAALSAGNKYPVTLELFSTTADISESPVTATPLATLRGPTLGSQLVVSAAPSIGSSITFPSTKAFTDAFDAAAGAGGDGRLTVLAQIVSCPGTGAYTIDFGSHESGTAARLTVAKNTAIALSTFRAADPAVNWPLIAGLGALAAAVIGGLAVARRRATTH